MVVAITKGVEIRAFTSFKEDFSELDNNLYYFNYEIHIENHNTFPIQLISRNWFIFDSLHDAVHVQGEGVVGEQPILKQQEKFNYVSGCEIYSEIGYMKGFYTFKNLENGTHFQVQIPRFELIYPNRLN